MSEERDPNGLAPSAPGAKLDAGKHRLSMVLLGFSRALNEVGAVGTFGARKYSDRSWRYVTRGSERYTDAMLRHLLAEGIGESDDAETKMLHAAHVAWNALARLELILVERDEAGRPRHD